MLKLKHLIVIGIALCIPISGCATVRHAVPPGMSGKAEINGMPEVRSFADATNPLMEQSVIESFSQESKDDYPVDSSGIRFYPVLAISGGAANGAYGAGMLKGWTASGSRPSFKIITGISTGALIAPLAFLGKDYDDELENFYTKVSTKDVMRPKNPLAAVFGDSLASSKPLQRQIAVIADEKNLQRIAAEHKRGRRLFVGTANLDAQKLMIWDMGAIACKGDIKLFRKVLLASASIPVTFPPVFFKVQADGAFYDEMHVDGGTVTQVFGIFGMIHDRDKLSKVPGLDPSKMKQKLYIIRNGYIAADPQVVKDTLGTIAGRTVDTLTNYQAIGDIYRIYTYAAERGTDFNLAYIPVDFKPEAKELFDPAEMNRLFQRGYEDAKNGYQWRKTPPGFDELTKTNK